MGLGRDKRDDGAEVSTGGPASRHAEDGTLGAARHLGSLRGMPVWLKVVTAVVSVPMNGGIAFA